MQERGRVVGIDGKVVRVVPLDIEACIGCSNAGCRSQGSVFEAENPRGLPLAVGAEVRVVARAGSQAAQLAVAVLFPIAAGAGGFACIPWVVQGAGEGARVLAAFACAALAAGIAAFARRLVPPRLPEVAEILD